MRTYPPLPPVGASPEGVGEAREHLPEEAGTRAAARAVLDGRKKGLLAALYGRSHLSCSRTEQRGRHQ
jgi:hypothetical protein